jgi:hypothetical protein
MYGPSSMQQPPQPPPPPPPAEMLCESCGKFIGSIYACPHCGASKYRRVKQRNLIVCALILFIIGIIYLPLAQIYSVIPVTNIADLTEDDSFNYIRIKGFVYSTPFFEPEEYDDNKTGIIRFRVTDGTGNITVKSYRLTSEKLIATGKIPAFGDYVDIEGVALIGETYVILKLTDIENLRIEKRVYKHYTISEIATASKTVYEEGTKVQITGKISRLVRTYEHTFALFFDVSDDSGNYVTVFIPTDVILLTGGFESENLQSLQLNINVTVCGALKWYEPAYAEGRWEIIPASINQIVIGD